MFMYSFVLYWLQSEANAANQTILLCVFKSLNINQSNVQTTTAENKEQYTMSFITYIEFQNWGVLWSRASLDVNKLFEIYL